MKRALLCGGDGRATLVQAAPAGLRSQSEVRVAVEWAGVNSLDVLAGEGYGSPLLERTRGRLFVPGLEFVGRVTQLGRNVLDLRRNDLVWGAVDPWSACGTLREELCVHEADLARCPQNLAPERAAAMPYAVMTVWRAVILAARRRRARSALVYGAGGNVGSVAAALLRELVPSMQVVVGVGREGYTPGKDGDLTQFDMVVDASASQGEPLDLEEFVAPSGSYVTFNGPWLTKVKSSGIIKGSIDSFNEVVEKKAQFWTRNGSGYQWGLMRASGNKALAEVAAAFDEGKLQALKERPLKILTMEETALEWGRSLLGTPKKVVRIHDDESSETSETSSEKTKQQQQVPKKGKQTTKKEKKTTEKD